MTAALTPLATPAAAQPARPAAQPFGPRILVGMLGVLLASLSAGLNDKVTDLAMNDVRGALAIGHDESTWLLALYAAFQVAGMAFAPWFSVTLSLRRFTLAAIAAFALLALLCPFAPNVHTLYLLRALQGLAGGCLPPMLMTVALRFLPPGIKLYGLGAYALTATFAPNLGMPLAALWTEYVGWQWVFWQVIPLCALAMAAVAWGIPQDPPRLERFRQFDWLGVVLGLPGILMLVLGLLQGERLDWFESDLVALLVVGGAALLAAFFLNEWTHPLPFFRLDILKRRNLSHSLLTLAGVLVVLGACAGVPASYLAAAHGYRPLQSAPMALLVALPQLLTLPLVAALCNIPRVDCRWVLAIGIALCGLSAYGMSQLTGDWTRDNFYLLLSLQIIGQPMAVVPLLMSSTSVVAPVEGPFASAWFNSVRAFAAVVGSSVVGILMTWREHYHSNRLVDHLGAAPQALALRLDQLDGSLPRLAGQVHGQASVLAAADTLWCMAWLAAALLPLIAVMPLRVYPPRPVAPAH
ncbi:MFS transporter [Pseudomonas citronellolis]|uniref:MFS transporter n=1 Tax=Pseudomonas citronellolis TaxID=53408 RepID=UPI0021130B63|nr:MFS transporter [Pseudomonas citronellolis]UUC48146.1 MFS transporter [Pseudomonas citronellolis]